MEVLGAETPVSDLRVPDAHATPDRVVGSSPTIPPPPHSIAISLEFVGGGARKWYRRRLVKCTIPLELDVLHSALLRRCGFGVHSTTGEHCVGIEKRRVLYLS